MGSVQPHLRLTPVRRRVAKTSAVALGFFTLVLVYTVFGFVYYRTTGRLWGEFTEKDMQAGEVGTFVGGYLIWAAFLGWGAWPLRRGWNPGRRTATQAAPGASRATPSTAWPPPSGRSGPADASPRPGTSSRPTWRVEPDATRDLPESAPVPALGALSFADLDAIRRLIDDVVGGYRTAEVRDDVASQQRSNRRDVVLLVAGTVLGTVAPVVAAPLLRLISI